MDVLVQKTGDGGKAGGVQNRKIRVGKGNFRRHADDLVVAEENILPAKVGGGINAGAADEGEHGITLSCKISARRAGNG